MKSSPLAAIVNDVLLNLKCTGNEGAQYYAKILWEIMAIRNNVEVHVRVSEQ